MTLVIAGYNFEDDWDWNSINSSNNNQRTPKEQTRPAGIYFASDSAITNSDGKVLLSGFRKIYSIPIKLWKPYFINGYFRSYYSTYLETSCAIAFAGGTLTAQHALNGITKHLANLRISYRYKQHGNSGEYTICMDCQNNILENPEKLIQFSNDMFLDEHFDKILTADYIAKVIEHSINTAISSAKKYKLGPQDFPSLIAEFAAGIHCPSTHDHKLFLFKIEKTQDSDGIYQFSTKRKLLNYDEIAVLGLHDRFATKAKQILQSQSAEKNYDAATLMYDFINSAIDELTHEGNREIDRPSILKLFSKGELNLVKHSDQTQTS